MNINYNHLYYFWTVARLGGVTKGAEYLCLTPQTVSAQITSLEQRLGNKLFVKQGRTLHLTEFGITTKQYADEIFDKAEEFFQTINSGVHHVTTVCRVGITDSVPKSLISKWLAPIKQRFYNMELECQDGTQDSLLSALSVHNLDVVITDSPVDPSYPLKVDCESIATSNIGFFKPDDIDLGDGEFPECLSSAPMVMPGRKSPLTFNIKEWLKKHEVSPATYVYADDIALMKTLARDGFGLVAAPMIVGEEIQKNYQVEFVGETEELIQDYYLITPQRTVVHPIVAIISEAAKLEK